MHSLGNTIDVRFVNAVHSKSSIRRLFHQSTQIDSVILKDATTLELFEVELKSKNKGVSLCNLFESSLSSCIKYCSSVFSFS